MTDLVSKGKVETDGGIELWIPHACTHMHLHTHVQLYTHDHTHNKYYNGIGFIKNKQQRNTSC